MYFSKKYHTDIVEDKNGKSHTVINQPFFIGDDVFDFRCKKGMTWRKTEDGTFKRNFEYEIKLRSRDNMRNFYISFSPEISKFHYGLSKKYGDYQPYKLKKRCEGVNVQVNTVNYSYESGQEILKEIFRLLSVDKFWDNQRMDMGIIKQCEYYIRYNNKYERKIGQIIQDMQQVIGFTGTHQTKVTCDVRNFKYFLYSLRSSRFSELGFNTNEDKWNFAIKTYRAKEYRKFQEGQPLFYPKLEIYFDEEKKDGYPELKDFYKIQNTMYQIMANIIKWAKIKDEDGYIIDSYFDNEKFIDIEFIESKEVYEKLKNYYSSMMPEIKTDCYKSFGMYDYYNCVLDKGNPSYDDLCLSTGFSKEWIRKISKKLEAEKLIKRIRSVKTFVQFHSNKIMEISKAIIKSFEFEMNLNDDSRKERKEKRVRSRKSRKIKPTILEQGYIKKSGVRLLAKIGIVNKVNGGLYRLQNIDFLKEKPENYKQLVRDYG